MIGICVYIVSYRIKVDTKKDKQGKEQRKNEKSSVGKIDARMELKKNKGKMRRCKNGESGQRTKEMRKTLLKKIDARMEKVDVEHTKNEKSSAENIYVWMHKDKEKRKNEKSSAEKNQCKIGESGQRTKEK
ncbi:hypothetical protein Pfo_003718 [Paulownia fortunei]|nr:hypothetical protein Pfo_003718 [Paulownia fortunei]